MRPGSPECGSRSVRPAARGTAPADQGAVPTEDLNAIRRLQALMDIARVVGGDESIPSVLDAIARVLTDTVGFAGVVINVYRPAVGRLRGGHRRRVRPRCASSCSAPPTTRPGSSSSSTSGSTGAARTSSPRARSTGRPPPSARASCPSRSRSATTTGLAPRRRAVRPLPRLRRRDPRDHLPRRAGLRAALVRHRARLPRRRRPPRRARARAGPPHRRGRRHRAALEHLLAVSRSSPRRSRSSR